MVVYIASLIPRHSVGGEKEGLGTRLYTLLASALAGPIIGVGSKSSKNVQPNLWWRNLHSGNFLYATIVVYFMYLENIVWYRTTHREGFSQSLKGLQAVLFWANPLVWYRKSYGLPDSSNTAGFI